MPFLNVLAVLLCLAGPVVGFEMGMRWAKPRRWKQLAWCAGFGAAAAVLFIGAPVVTALMDARAAGFVSAGVRLIGGYALFGLLVGSAAMVPRPAGTPRLIVTTLAMMALLMVGRAAFNAATGRPPEQGASGVVFGPNGVPAAGAALFLDRGSGPVERLTTDATGLFRMAAGRIGAPRPLLLICVAGGVPYVARPIEYMRTPERYRIVPLQPRAFVRPGIRALGWRRPIPPECLAGSADVQQVAAGDGARPEPGVAQQSGTAKAAAADHQEFVGWPSELAPRAPAFADAIQHRYGDRPYAIAFAGRDTMDISFSEPSFWRNDLGPTLPRESMPVVAKGARDLAGYVLNGFGRVADVKVVRVTFIRVREEHQLGVTRRVPAQEVSVLYTRGMLERGSKEVPMLAVTQGDALRGRLGYRRWLARLSEQTVNLGRGARMERVDPVASALVMSPDGSGASTQRAVAADSLTAARNKMAQSSAALAHAIVRDVGQRPADITLTGRDTIDVRFWNPSFWWQGDSLKSVPEASLPVVSQAAKGTAKAVWERYARDEGINVIRIRFVRVRRDRVTSTLSEAKDAQEVTVRFTRQQLESGQLDGVQLTIVQR